MRCRHCGVELSTSNINSEGQPVWGGPDGMWTCESVGQGQGGTNHEPEDLMRCRHCDDEIAPSGWSQHPYRTAGGPGYYFCNHGNTGTHHEPADGHVETPAPVPQRCRHCGILIIPSLRRRGRYHSPDQPDRLGRQMCVDGDGNWHEPGTYVPPPEPSINEGRLNINVGRHCQRCSEVITDGQRSERRWGDDGQSVYTYHLNPVCHRLRDARGRFMAPPQPVRYRMTDTAWGSSNYASAYTTTASTTGNMWISAQ